MSWVTNQECWGIWDDGTIVFGRMYSEDSTHYTIYTEDGLNSFKKENVYFKEDDLPDWAKVKLIVST